MAIAIVSNQIIGSNISQQKYESISQQLSNSILLRVPAYDTYSLPVLSAGFSNAYNFIICMLVVIHTTMNTCRCCHHTDGYW